MRLFRRRMERHPAYLFSPSVGGLLTFGAVLGAAYHLWPMLGFDSQADVAGAVTASTTVGYELPASEPLPTTLTVTRVRSVYDGDTFRVEARELVSADGWGIPIRVRGVDAPELDGECEREVLLAKASRQWLVERFNRAKEIALVNVDFAEDRYGRIVADVVVDSSTLSREMIDVGAAKAWLNGSTHKWCG